MAEQEKNRVGLSSLTRENSALKSRVFSCQAG